MNWDIKKVFIGSSQLNDEERILSEVGAQGWEPYGMNGSFHYFKRALKGESQIPALSFDDNLKEIEATRLKLGTGSSHIPLNNKPQKNGKK